MGHSDGIFVVKGPRPNTASSSRISPGWSTSFMVICENILGDKPSCHKGEEVRHQIEALRGTRRAASRSVTLLSRRQARRKSTYEQMMFSPVQFETEYQMS